MVDVVLKWGESKLQDAMLYFTLTLKELLQFVNAIKINLTKNKESIQSLIYTQISRMRLRKIHLAKFFFSSPAEETIIISLLLVIY